MTELRSNLQSRHCRTSRQWHPAAGRVVETGVISDRVAQNRNAVSEQSLGTPSLRGAPQDPGANHNQP